MEFGDFLDFKKLSKDLRVLTVRNSGMGKTINWTDIMEIMVKKSELSKIFFKTSHTDNNYDYIELKRIQGNPVSCKPAALNKTILKLSKKKYDDLVSLCKGDTPIIRSVEHQNYFMHLPHEDE